MVAVLVVLAVLLALVATVILLFAGSMSAAGVPSLLVGIGLMGLAGVLAIFARIEQARAQHKRLMDALHKGS